MICSLIRFKNDASYTILEPTFFGVLSFSHRRAWEFLHSGIRRLVKGKSDPFVSRKGSIPGSSPKTLKMKKLRFPETIWSEYPLTKSILHRKTKGTLLRIQNKLRQGKDTTNHSHPSRSGTTATLSSLLILNVILCQCNNTQKYAPCILLRVVLSTQWNQ